jgi:hypothetical protein
MTAGRIGLWDGLLSLVTVAGLALLVPIIILVLGAPVALLARAAAELFEWVAALLR